MSLKVNKQQFQSNSLGAQTGALIYTVLRQLLWRFSMLVSVSLLVFLILRLIPVDPISMLLPPSADKQDVARLSTELGLNEPVLIQFLTWLQNAVQLDFGQSLQSGLPVIDTLSEALPITIQLLVFGIICGVFLGLLSGLTTFYLRSTFLERPLLTLNAIMLAVPDYLWGIILIITLGVTLQWLPFLGPVDANIHIETITGFLIIDSLLTQNWQGFTSVIKHLILPSLSLGICVAPPIARVLYSSLSQVYKEDYILGARLRGLTEKQILLHHALRNAALPTISLIGVQISVIIGGTLVIETIFGLPGIGNLMLKAMGSFDLLVIQALTVVYALAIQLVTACTDLILLSLNPRLRYQK
ncbi:ABC transporter permease [Paraglaciecola sp. L3A3]|uniref:ABC transporter permease n=1 Tax=Paraglaciecola sp. L3A3 TaxID=2686358 RepID=UPI00131B4F8B|nr:ABC transporter permease [Paraglaciecola sp. L3A3]